MRLRAHLERCRSTLQHSHERRSSLPVLCPRHDGLFSCASLNTDTAILFELVAGSEELAGPPIDRTAGIPAYRVGRGRRSWLAGRLLELVLGVSDLAPCDSTFDTEVIHMDFNFSDAMFLAIVIWLAITILNSGDGGGGRRARVPIPCAM